MRMSLFPKVNGRVSSRDAFLILSSPFSLLYDYDIINIIQNDLFVCYEDNLTSNIVMCDNGHLSCYKNIADTLNLQQVYVNSVSIKKGQEF